MASIEHQPSGTERPEDPIRLKVELNRHLRHMYGIPWKEQYGDPVEALANARIPNIASMIPEEQLRVRERLRTRLLEMGTPAEKRVEE